MNSSSTTQIARNEKERGLWQPLFVIAIFLVLAVRLFRQVSRYAVNIFYWDQWIFNNATLFERHSLWEMFRWQHGPHRLGLGALLSNLLEPHFRWNARSEAFLATAIVFVAALLALYLKTTLYGALSLSDIAIPIIFLTPAQYESLETPDFAHGPLPLLLLVLYCLALTCERAATRYVLVVLVNFLAIYTGFGLLIGFITPLWFVFEYQSRRANHEGCNLVLIPLALSLASLASFFSGYTMAPSVDCFSVEPGSPAGYLNFVVLMLSHFFGGRHTRSIAALLLGGIVLGTMLFVLVRLGMHLKQSRNYAAKDVVPMLLVGYALFFCVVCAYGRTCLGPIAAFGSRYTEYVALGVLGLYFYSLGGGRAQKAVLRSLVVMLLLGSVWTHEDSAAMQYDHDVKDRWRSCYLETEAIQECNQAVGHWIYPFAEQTDLKKKLRYLKQTKQNLYSDSD